MTKLGGVKTLTKSTYTTNSKFYILQKKSFKLAQDMSKIYRNTICTVFKQSSVCVCVTILYFESNVNCKFS